MGTDIAGLTGAATETAEIAAESSLTEGLIAARDEDVAAEVWHADVTDRADELRVETREGRRLAGEGSMSDMVQFANRYAAREAAVRAAHLADPANAR
jgi:hypothetical protein